MDIFSIFTLLGGLAFFLYGINLMSVGLEKIAGGKLESILKKMTSNPFKGFALGTVVTAIIQSSSAVTVMLVGLVNSGLMNLSQTVSVIIGSNIGTTITAWILSLTGIKGSYGILFELFKPKSFTPILALIGICLIMMAKTNKRKNVGNILIGFAILMFGMQVMSDSMAPLADMPEFTQIMTAFSHPLLGILIGAIVTMIIQSSSASVGILQALSLVGGVTWGAAIPIIMGQNIGTCISAILSSIGTNVNARRVAGVHIIFNILGVIIIFPLFVILNSIFHFAFVNTDINPAGVAIAHTLFNVISAVMLFPFAKFIEKMAVKAVPDKNGSTQNHVLLDERLLLAPSFAISECRAQSIKMAAIVEHNFVYATKLLKSFHQKKADQILENETKIDTYEDVINKFLIKLSGKALSGEDNNRISQLLIANGDYERIGDHAANMVKISKQLSELKTKLSDKAVEELKVIVNAVSEIYSVSLEAYKNDDVALAQEVEPLEVVIKKIIRKVKADHIQRLKDGECTTEASFLFSDLLADFRRIAAHCGNIAISVIQLKDSTLGKHAYNHRNKDEDSIYMDKYKNYKSKFSVSKLKLEN